ncbi:RraA family protein [Caldivirga maquilingensis]|uniref:RraA family protein n=1 Tax=Caldivirga maquilingensis TaxID=76887 RepID=UPI0018DBCED1|nr:RraA family protein [Caldivirga maquilingensis]
MNFEYLSRVLYSPVISDALDELGIYNHALPSYILPINPDYVVMGYAYPMYVGEANDPNPDNPYEGLIEAVDAVPEDSVIVIEVEETIRGRTAVWGELTSTAAMARGARGVVVHGLIRDVNQVLRLGFPVFAVGKTPYDIKGRGEFKGHGIEVTVGDVRVKVGDLVFGDINGVVIVPKEVMSEVINRAIEKVNRESTAKSELRRGAYLKDIWGKYKVL